MKKILYGIIVVLILAILYVQFTSPSTNLETSQDTPDQGVVAGGSANIPDIAVSSDDEGDAMEDEGDAMMESTPDVTFVMGGENFKFTMDGEDNPDLTVNEGDLVRIEFTSDSGFHDWVVDEFVAATEQVRPDDGVTVVEFVADQTGTFEYYCSVGSHRANGMWGNFIVE